LCWNGVGNGDGSGSGVGNGVRNNGVTTGHGDDGATGVTVGHGRGTETPTRVVA
jgi:hypothetical protein